MTTYYVYSGASGDNDGSTWGNAYETIPQALNVATNGDQVWVKEGVYQPGSEGFVVPEGVSVYGGFSRQLSGTAGTVSGRTSTVYSIVDGQATNPGFKTGQDNVTIDGFMIVFCTDTDGAAIMIGWDYYYGSELLTDGDMELAGVANWPIGGSGSDQKDTYTVYGDDQSLLVSGSDGGYAYQAVMTSTHTYRVTGYAYSSGTAYGVPSVMDGAVTLWTHSGSQGWEYFDEEFTATSTQIRLVANAGETNTVYFDNISLKEKLSASAISGITVNNCKLLSNEATNRGGAIRIYGASDVEITNCIFYKNVALYGGAIEIYDSSTVGVEIDACTFDGNEGTTGCGAIWNKGTGVVITNTIFKNNIGDYANIYNTEALVITNSVIAKGVSSDVGGIYTTSDVYITNCTIADNDDIAIKDIFDAVVMTNSIVWGNDTNFSGTPTVTYSNVEGGYAGTGNVDDDPLFVGEGLHEYVLSAISDSVDSANSGATYYESTDLRGAARYDHPSVTNTGAGTPAYADMGAYEFQGSPILTMPMSLYYLDQSSTGGEDGWYYMYAILRLPEMPRQFGGGNNVGQTPEGVKHEITSEILTDDVDSTLVEQVFIDDHLAAYRSVQNMIKDPPTRDVEYQTDFQKDGDPYTSVEMQHPKLLPFMKMPQEYYDKFCYCIVTFRWLPNYDTNSHIHIYNVDFKQFHDDEYEYDDANVCFHPGTTIFSPDVPLSSAHMKALHDSLLKMIYEGTVAISVPVFGQYAIPVV
jgi:hypothetical protein